MGNLKERRQSYVVHFHNLANIDFNVDSTGSRHPKEFQG
jgi:hypothetical protein